MPKESRRLTVLPLPVIAVQPALSANEHVALPAEL
jgi:hypothetical protein